MAHLIINRGIEIAASAPAALPLISQRGWFINGGEPLDGPLKPSSPGSFR
ncbi:hypothetical protein [Brevibacterium luteolum]|uniref:Uncharacterized protein n=1 Tax=Brevibacterium luteolum TaxID=199591 RepID=A0A849AWC0_9MICO|nr:hypothetical protein [Brevibacterium luteolum]MBM7528855.1 hypothetical protein [Brevibacterium luteolum]MCT1657011.1 hypothetical protein [Brevibacterium luteolum]MCT1874339.1 hypothetical protein [Brevibacterium luteolum]MCT1889969.1 hypothetical protein [Brevibacterium luteolum]MCT1894021.1 hypothetical protein [Brevibacterium luteolum]